MKVLFILFYPMNLIINIQLDDFNFKLLSDYDH